MKTIDEIENKCFGTVFKLTEFIQLVESGYITDYDGIGYFHDGESEVEYPPVICSIPRLSQHVNDYPYVCWYNK